MCQDVLLGLLYHMQRLAEVLLFAFIQAGRQVCVGEKAAWLLGSLDFGEDEDESIPQILGQK